MGTWQPGIVPDAGTREGLSLLLAPPVRLRKRQPAGQWIRAVWIGLELPTSEWLADVHVPSTGGGRHLPAFQTESFALNVKAPRRLVLRTWRSTHQKSVGEVARTLLQRTSSDRYTIE
jgi:hypothetical protein